ncbi:aminoglycoside phosphotransferase family protein [Amycolatopsis sp.]|uniref:aminoglycoside phosphotransferase family protein n=1 Tax=Amycolatopsis sp. TaxID=37632 RepID=UPI002C500EE1|nr:aminoglycoside phosphotransferase family protein [Amycolatopsis sp.]HVV09966.1 aminoglycoside phosphotransferase family protein [Amycolatopsis sp.]
MVDGYVTAALAAATDVARRLGLPADDPELLATRSNVLVKLGPAVARVPATTLLLRPDAAASLARDVARSAFLAERDAPVIPPLENPGPHVAQGLPVTLWRFTRHDPGYRADPVEAGALLSDLHQALREFPGEAGGDGPAVELRRMAAFTGDPRVADEVERVLATLPPAPAQPLHGDAHVGNLMLTPAGPRWLDFEDTWHGPVAWDVACLIMRSPGALAGYPEPPGEDVLAPYLRLRRLFGVCWQFLIARRFPERLAGAREALAEYFG